MDSQNETTHVLIASCWFYFETFVAEFIIRMKSNVILHA